MQNPTSSAAPETSPPLCDELGTCLVTGAAGFVGRNLVATLLDGGCRVRALVHQTPLALEHPALECVSGKVEDPAAVLEACEGVDTVFHTAALIGLLGGSSATAAYRRPAWTVNVLGSENVIRACRRQGVGRLVHTSSVDVCFDGTPNPDMDQRTPYADRPASVYQESKIAAEKQVLAADGDGDLHTCAIRADGIFGPEPNVILDTIVTQVALGRLQAAIGSPGTKQDNTYIRNLIHGEILAARHLGPGGSACGKAYFISDYAPQNTFEFFRPLIEGLGCEVPSRRIPRGLVRPLLVLWQHLHFRLGVAAPPVTPHELDKISVTHYGSIRDAERELGYRPIVSHEEAMAECLPYCRELFERTRARRRAGGDQIE